MPVTISANSSEHGARRLDFREECSFHGLRKAACRRLAEAGCSVNEIAAVSGHATLREVQRYTKAVDQERMARSARQANDSATASVKS